MAVDVTDCSTHLPWWTWEPSWSCEGLGAPSRLAQSSRAPGASALSYSTAALRGGAGDEPPAMPVLDSGF